MKTKQLKNFTIEPGVDWWLSLKKRYIELELHVKPAAAVSRYTDDATVRLIILWPYAF